MAGVGGRGPGRVGGTGCLPLLVQPAGSTLHLSEEYRAGPPTNGRTRHTRRRRTRRSRSRQGRGAQSWGTGSAQIRLDPPGPAQTRPDPPESVRCRHRPLPLPLLGLLARRCSEDRQRRRRRRRRRRGQRRRRRRSRSRAPFRTQRPLRKWRMPRRMTFTPCEQYPSSMRLLAIAHFRPREWRVL